MRGVDTPADTNFLTKITYEDFVKIISDTLKASSLWDDQKMLPNVLFSEDSWRLWKFPSSVKTTQFTLPNVALDGWNMPKNISQLAGE